MTALLENQSPAEDVTAPAAPRPARRRRNVSVRPTPAELAELHARAGSFGFKSLSQYLIFRGLERGVLIESADRERVERLLYEARRIGRNVNQLAKWANSGGRGLARERVEQAAREAERVVREIGEVFAGR